MGWIKNHNKIKKNIKVAATVCCLILITFLLFINTSCKKEEKDNTKIEANQANGIGFVTNLNGLGDKNLNDEIYKSLLDLNIDYNFPINIKQPKTPEQIETHIYSYINDEKIKYIIGNSETYKNFVQEQGNQYKNKIFIIFTNDFDNYTFPSNSIKFITNLKSTFYTAGFSIKSYYKLQEELLTNEISNNKDSMYKKIGIIFNPENIESREKAKLIIQGLEQSNSNIHIKFNSFENTEPIDFQLIANNFLTEGIDFLINTSNKYNNEILTLTSRTTTKYIYLDEITNHSYSSINIQYNFQNGFYKILESILIKGKSLNSIYKNIELSLKQKNIKLHSTFSKNDEIYNRIINEALQTYEK